ncbi:MAG: zinc-binding dehydrogenase [Pseudomonadota bacterium]
MTPAPAVMAGVQLTGHGGPECLVWNGAISVPEPGPGEALVQVLAAGVNNTDINTRIGWYAPSVTGSTAEAADAGGAEAGGWAGALAFPRIQGGDLCGRVVAVGEGVALAPGTRVTCPINQSRATPASPRAFEAMGSEFDGAFAEYVCLKAADLYDVSASPLSDVEIAAMPCAHGTALNLLDRARVVAGERVLVTGASGGVGLAAVQLAAHLGAEVIAVTSPEKAEAVRAAGAAEVLARGALPPKQSLDAVIDVVGGPGFGALLATLKAGGRLAVSGAVAGPIVEADLRQVYLRDLSILGATWQDPAVFAKLVAWINEGAIRPLVSQTYPLAEIHRAQADFAAKTHAGKLVLLPPGHGSGGQP